MKLYMIRKTLEDGTKQYAGSGLTFSSSSSKSWGRIGNLKSAIRNRCGGFYRESYDTAFHDWFEFNTRENETIDILEIDIDNVNIKVTDIKTWYDENMRDVK